MKSLHWYTDDLRETLRSWPDEIRKGIGHQIRDVQNGEFPAGAKWWKSVGDQVIQLKEKGARVIVTVAFGEDVWCVHAFDKDSNETRRQHKELVRKRVVDLERRYAANQRKH